jgi:hypothetical protein
MPFAALGALAGGAIGAGAIGATAAGAVGGIAGGIGLGASLGAGFDQYSAVGGAASAQQQAAQAGIAEQQRQFNTLVQLMSPYVSAGAEAVSGLAPYQAVGPEALQQQRALAGLAGLPAQQAAIEAIKSSPQFRVLTNQGENAILQQAAATGGLRGGNVQAALAQFRPQLLAQQIEAQYGRLGGLSALGQQTTQNLAQLGQAGAAGQAAGGLQTAANIANLQGDIGAAQAGGILGQAGTINQTIGGLANIFGSLGGLGSSVAPVNLSNLKVF